ncbi:MAG: hypothetical protein IT457_18005 [Planctomycetes bacterium]|nr:hypothetical protein [Planctomycetota bacterium]
MISRLLPLFVLAATACSSPARTGDAARARAPKNDPTPAVELRDAERKLAEGDAYAALDVLDVVLRRSPDDRAARLLAARANTSLADAGVPNAEQFLATAARHYELALGIERADPETLIALSALRLRLGRFHDGRDAAIEGAEFAAANGRARLAADALLQAAANELQLLVAARSAELENGTSEPESETIRLGTTVIARLRAAEAAGALPGTTRARSADVLRWLGRQSEALQELEIAVRATPDSAEANAAFQDLWWQMDGHGECIAAYKRMLDESPSSAPLVFYMGRAQVGLADKLRRDGRFDEASRAYADALATWQRYDGMRPGDHALSTHWLAICELSIARLEFEQGRLDRAEAGYAAAFATDARVAEFDESGSPRIFDSFGGNYLGGLSMIGMRLTNGSGDTALEDALAFWQRVIERHPGRFGSVYNNAALTARDLGVKVVGEDDAYTGPAGLAASEGARRERLTRAMALWEQSYAWYRAAVELEPNDARIVNDCGLMLLYHLHREYDIAQRHFERAIELGEAALAGLSADAEAAQREFLEEATGDAWQNLGLLRQQRQAKPVAEWRPCFEKAVQYFPYQRREAARILAQLERGEPLADQDKPDPRQAKFDALLVKAEEAAGREDWDGALTVLDGAKKELDGFAPYHHRRGVYSLRMAQQSARDGGNAGLIDGLFQDAVRQLEKSVALDGKPLAPRQALAETQLVRGEYAAAFKTIESLLSHARSIGGAKDSELLAAHTVRAEAAARAYVATQSAEDPAVKQGGAELLTATRSSMQELEKAGKLDAPLRGIWINAERWAKADAQALAIAVRQYQRDANSVGELVALGAELGDSRPVLEALSKAEDATALWWRGRTSFDLAVQEWSGGEGEKGLVTLDAAIALFEKSKRANPEFSDSCEQWATLCLGQKGTIQTSRDDLDGAAKSLLAAIARRPDLFPDRADQPSEIRRATLVLADRFFRKGDLARVVELYRAAGAAAPDDVDVANNEGLFCRDHGDQVRRTDAKAAAELYEAALAAYTRATKLDPSNPRLLNDCAVILIYGLEREPERARELCEKSIAIGEKRLAEDPPAEADDLRNLQEAVGDAYGNLGVLYSDTLKDIEKAKTNLKKSLEFYPFERRAGSRLLQQLDGETRK